MFAEPREESFACTWEDAATLLEQLPGMIFEPDGSFILSGSDHGEHRWHVNGHLFDFAGRLHRMELSGECPAEAFDGLLRCVGWPGRRVEFQLVREGVDFGEEDFRRRAAANQEI